MIWWDKLEIIGGLADACRWIFVKKSVITCGGASLLESILCTARRRGVTFL